MRLTSLSSFLNPIAISLHQGPIAKALYFESERHTTEWLKLPLLGQGKLYLYITIPS